LSKKITDTQTRINDLNSNQNKTAEDYKTITDLTNQINYYKQNKQAQDRLTSQNEINNQVTANNETVTNLNSKNAIDNAKRQADQLRNNIAYLGN